MRLVMLIIALLGLTCASAQIQDKSDARDDVDSLLEEMTDLEEQWNAAFKVAGAKFTSECELATQNTEWCQCVAEKCPISILDHNQPWLAYILTILMREFPIEQDDMSDTEEKRQELYRIARTAAKTCRTGVN